MGSYRRPARNVACLCRAPAIAIPATQGAWWWRWGMTTQRLWGWGEKRMVRGREKTSGFTAEQRWTINPACWCVRIARTISTISGRMAQAAGGIVLITVRRLVREKNEKKNCSLGWRGGRYDNPPRGTEVVLRPENVAQEWLQGVQKYNWTRCRENERGSKLLSTLAHKQR